MDVPDWVRALLACPHCRGALAWKGSEAECTGCRRRYPVRDGVPDLLPESARPPAGVGR